MDKPSETDQEDLFDETGSDANLESDESTQEEENVQELSLAELNELAGREGNRSFKNKEDFFNHYNNLKSFVGKAKKEPKSEKVEKVDEVSALKARIDAMEASAKREGFLSSNPEVKDKLDIIEAYAEKNGISLEDAWKAKQELFTNGETSSVGIKSVNRVLPVSSGKDLQQLEARARQGDDKAQVELVARMLHG